MRHLLSAQRRAVAVEILELTAALLSLLLLAAGPLPTRAERDSSQLQHFQHQQQLQQNLIGANPQYQQHNNILHFVVPEGAPNNTYLGNIRSADGQPPYLVLPAPQTPESERVAALSVNLLNGDLTTNSVLDREHREQYHFVAIVKEPFAEIKCTVTVKDINDNAPMFLTQQQQQVPNAVTLSSNNNAQQQANSSSISSSNSAVDQLASSSSISAPSASSSSIVIEMPEGQRGIRKVLPLAVDLDTPQFGIKEFRIVSGNTPSGTFQLVEHEAPARSALQSNQLLAGVDDGQTMASMMLAANDNPQLMQQLAQQATVLIPSQPILQSSPAVVGSNSATANTATSSANTNSAGAQQSSKFLIDLEVNQILDRENQSSYQLVVEAIDGGQPPLLGRLMVTVNVQDVNDNDPVFTRKLYECHFREETAKGTLLLRVQAHDSDLDANGQVSYYIKRHSPSSQPNTNLINSNSSDNIESSSSAAGRFASTSKQQNSRQQVTATSALGGGASTSKRTNEAYANEATTSNGDPAAFGKSKLPASSYPGSMVAEQMFEIDPIKGEIYLAHQLDYETDQMHELLIEARDHGKPSRSAFAIVKVFVIDVNDDPPPSAINRPLDDRTKQFTSQAPSSEASRSELTIGSRLGVGDLTDATQNYFLQNFNLLNWFSQSSSSLLFVIVLVALFAVAFSVCLVKIKSGQPESDYNDTAGLTLTSNNGQAKQSPNHSTSNEHSNGSSQDTHHRHHDHQRRSNGSFSGLNGTCSAFGSANGKLRYTQHIDSSNLYHNPYQIQPHTSRTLHTSLQQPPDSPSQHQMAPAIIGLATANISRGSTMESSCPMATATQQPLDRWFDLVVSSQLVSYNWDYLTDWLPEY